MLDVYIEGLNGGDGCGSQVGMQVEQVQPLLRRGGGRKVVDLEGYQEVEVEVGSSTHQVAGRAGSEAQELKGPNEQVWYLMGA
jgi:hypothetical protein